MVEKLKSFARSEQTFMAVLLCLIGGICFLLGRYSVVAPTIQPAAVESAAGVIFIDTATQTPPASAIQVVASRNGTKYHRLDCSGANTIKEENKVYFDSIELAQAAGYTPAANCPGL